MMSSGLSEGMNKFSWRLGMSASVTRSNRRAQRAFVPTSALANAVEFTDERMQVLRTDSCILSVPLVWFPKLYAATPEQREYEKQCKLIQRKQHVTLLISEWTKRPSRLSLCQKRTTKLLTGYRKRHRHDCVLWN